MTLRENMIMEIERSTGKLVDICFARGDGSVLRQTKE
jgi:hypothetical protein